MESIKANIKTASTPDDWTKDKANKLAESEGLTLTEDHLAVLYALQEYYSRHDIKHIKVRELHDALNEKFHRNGGIKYVYSLFPGGPVAQGCRLAGLQPPAGAVDKGFGSVV